MSAESKVIGARLRELREADPYWTRGDLARLLRAAAKPQELPHVAHVSSLADMIKQWEAGKWVPGARYRRLYCRVTDVPEDELFAGSRPSSPPGGLGWALTPDEEDRLARAAYRPARVDATVVESLAAVLAAHRRTEDVIGSAPLLGPVHAGLAMLEELVTGTRGPIRPRVVNVAAQWAQFSGWLTSNVGDLAAGKRWLDRALEWAVETDDANLVSEVLSFKGHVAWRARQPGPVIGLSAAAMRKEGLFPGQYAMSAAQQARGYAMVGNAYESERLLEQALTEAAAARERADEAPPWLYYHSPGYYELQCGLIYRCLGNHYAAFNQRAVSALSRGLESLPGEMSTSEWAGEFVYQLGRAHAQGGDTEQARAEAENLAGLAERIGSDRLAEKASELR